MSMRMADTISRSNIMATDDYKIRSERISVEEYIEFLKSTVQ